MPTWFDPNVRMVEDKFLDEMVSTLGDGGNCSDIE
jgi:hypothetical protein